MLPTLWVRLHIVAWAQIHLRFELVPSGTFSSFACQVFDVSGGCTLGEIKQRHQTLSILSSTKRNILCEIVLDRWYDGLDKLQEDQDVHVDPQLVATFADSVKNFLHDGRVVAGMHRSLNIFCAHLFDSNLNLRKTSKTKVPQLQSI